MSEATFNSEQAKLRGMNEHSVSIPLNEDVKIIQTVFETANVSLIQSSDPEVLKYNFFYNYFSTCINIYFLDFAAKH